MVEERSADVFVKSLVDQREGEEFGKLRWGVPVVAGIGWSSPFVLLAVEEVVYDLRHMSAGIANMKLVAAHKIDDLSW